jgi:hypothetical protein
VQQVDGDNPAYQFSLPVYLKFDHGGYKYVYVDVKGKKTEASFDLAKKPLQASIDPNLTVMAFHRVRKPLAMWIDELKDGPSLAARVSAAEHLGAIAGIGEIESLMAAATDGRQDPVVREAALRAAVCIGARRMASAAGMIRWSRSMAAAGGPVMMFDGVSIEAGRMNEIGLVGTRGQGGIE